MESDKYMHILTGYTSSIFQYFEAHLKTVVDFVEDDIRLKLDGKDSSVIIFELAKISYFFKGISGFLAFNIEREKDPSHSNKIEVELLYHENKIGCNEWYYCCKV